MFDMVSIVNLTFLFRVSLLRMLFNAIFDGDCPNGFTWYEDCSIQCLAQGEDCGIGALDYVNAWVQASCLKG